MAQLTLRGKAQAAARLIGAILGIPHEGSLSDEAVPRQSHVTGHRFLSQKAYGTALPLSAVDFASSVGGTGGNGRPFRTR